MSFDFIKPVISINGKGGEGQFTFYKQGFVLNGYYKGTPTYIDILLSGVSPLVLVGAVADGLNYLKLFGGTELLPETYIDTVTLSGGCEQRNLPVGYTQVEYLGGTVYAYADLGTITIEPDDTLYCECILVDNDKQLFGLAGHTRCYIASSGSGRSSFANMAYDVPLEAWIIDGITVNTIKLTSSKFTINGVDFTPIGTASSDICSYFGINAVIYSSGSNTSVSYIKKFYIKSGSGNYKVNLIPSKNANNTFGFYDTVSQTLLTKDWTYEFIAGPDLVPSPSTPMDIVCNNGAIKASRNKFDYEYFYDHYQRYQTSAVGRCPIKLKPNTTYTISTNTQVSSNTASIFVVVGNSIDWTPTTNGNGVLVNSPVTRATDSSGYLCVGIYVSSGSAIPESDFDNGTVWVQIEEGSSATAYTPYSPDGIYTDGTVETVTDSLGNTASAERLLAVGTYKDTQEVISGSVTRNVGIKVLDGTEDWIQDTTSSNTPYVYSDTVITDRKVNTLGICTHFLSNQNTSAYGGSYYGTSTQRINLSLLGIGNEDLASFKQFLASQYAQGTPVIIVYPTSSTTSEAVAGQFLSKSPVEQTSGSISNLPIVITESEKTTPTPQQPLPINCNNGVVKVSKNLFDKNQPTLNLASTSTPSGTALATNNARYGKYLKVEPNTTYTISRTDSYYLNLCETSVVPAVDVRVFYTGMGTVSTYTIITQSTTQYLYIYSGDPQVASNIQVEKGSVATTYHPYGVYTDGTTETVEIDGNNLIDLSAVTNGYYYDAQGNYTSLSSARLTDYIPIEVGKDVKVYFKSLATVGNLNVRINIFNSNKVWQSQEVLALAPEADGTKIITPTYNGYIRVSGNYSTNQRVDWDTASVTELLGSATAQPLYKVGTYQDVQEVIAGGVTKNVGIKVLDGSENWSLISGAFATVLADTSMPNEYYNTIVRNTHFNGISPTTSVTAMPDLTSKIANSSGLGNKYGLFIKYNAMATVADFKQYLSQQYNAGTPVIVVYPLATPTTETVTAQPLSIQQGTNTVTITQASMDNLTLEVSYKAGAVVTITEVENSQLSDNVEVTIE